jgi:23S rRNA pseudouridine2457 synthase
LLFNKPFGVICQFSRDGLHPTLADYIPLPDFYPAGRLDTDSEGLLVLTDDGQLQHRITDPKHKLPKTYWVQVEGVPDEAALEQLRRGVKLADPSTRLITSDLAAVVGQPSRMASRFIRTGFTTQPAEVRAIEEPSGLWPRNPPIRSRKNIPTNWLELTIREGKNRQVRRMTAALGFPTLRLIRYRIGEWTLSGLEPGKWRIESP